MSLLSAEAEVAGNENCGSVVFLPSEEYGVAGDETC